MDIVACCENGEGECVSSGTLIYVPNFYKQTCEERDSSLVPDWETDFISSTMNACCEGCK